MNSDDQRQDQSKDGTVVGSSAIKWSAIVIIVIAILYFLAQFVMPLFS